MCSSDLPPATPNEQPEADLATGESKDELDPDQDPRVLAYLNNLSTPLPPGQVIFAAGTWYGVCV